MEELLSTEVLDREILEDARKKAFKILKSADDSMLSLSGKWEKKTRQAIEDIRAKHEKRIQAEREEIHAKGPLDKRRLRLEISEKFLRDAMDRFLVNLTREEILLILERGLRECLDACADVDFSAEDPRIIYQNMNEDEVRGVFKKLNRDINSWKISADKKPVSSFPVLAVNTTGIRISISAENAAMQMLKDYRAELAAALLGGGALND